MLSEYVSSLSHVRKLTWEEEMALWKRYKEDEDIEARQEIIEHYQLLVFKEAIKYPLQETVVLDLIQEGMVGLMEAAEKFNPDNGVAFSLYALHRVRGRMIDFLRQNRQEVLVDMQDEIQAQPYLQSATGDTAFESADFDSLNHAVSSAFSRLPGREQDVLRNVYYKEKTAAETADAMDVSTAYVYKLEKKGIRRMRGMLSRLMHDRK
ncbi:sigma-70 family RNA polymerase sigma factor [Allisonella histaminiformans]|uniref:sigma-70 family RNA polymerase sigma factor n=1 Tax=Allisonella histaminiformans TaxID=209880 RepID=UPI000D7915B0|nr:sigma-70 family RNA polymerase sigma factor [Allisonella histaminiformans]MCI6003437.1 sigma-70 family RNA polymerase sigma factor [Allisonella histaminiformans]MDD6870387.1 sigma-70 family RNA polymerase sigma factor [Allisonella histaminiformans]MDY3957037.1 sigma-70 family RNA polymerase sigma factor [Allisonella histaminiformans]PWL47040.1 MAG: RNA polymerase subunit sigma [Veillonellaceae bacterium]